jgi:curved DNA-binding protein CbpA
MKNLYLVLQIAPTATAEDVKAAYHRRALQCHPDRGGNAVAFEEVSAAYQVLSDPVRRKAYAADRALWLQEVGAVECPGCGEANRVRRNKPGTAPHCGLCDTRLPLPAVAPAPIVARAQALMLDIGEHVTTQAGDLMFDGVDSAFTKLRQKLGLERGKGTVR